MKLKAQVAVEFIFLVSIAFMMLLVFTTVIGNQTSGAEEEREFQMLKDYTYIIQSELYLAERTDADYYREFELLEYLGSKTGYTIDIIGNNLLLNTSDYEFTLSIPTVVGSLQKGTNKLNKTGTIIKIN